MIFLLLAATLQAAPAPAAPVTPAGPADPQASRYHHCLDLATSDPAKAALDASSWRLSGGGFVARQCLGIAYANQQNYAAAAAEFEGAAKDAEVAKDIRASGYWAAAGNAWLAGGDAVKAQAALDAALANGMLTGIDRGEAQLDRARALVAAGGLAAARSDIDHALETIADDPLAWLLSATLARRMNDLPRAEKDIAEALRRAPKEAPVQLEAGNIAALKGDEAGAKAAWSQAVTLAPGSPAAASAQKALDQFNPPAAPDGVAGAGPRTYLGR